MASLEARAAEIERADAVGAKLDAWPDALPLRREVSEPKAFPVDAMGQTLGDAVHAIVGSVQSPEALAAQSVLAAATLAAQAFADVEIDGRRGPLSEFFVTIGESGERKSTVDRIALRPHQERQRTLRETYDAEMRDYEIDLSAWKRAREDALKAKGKAAKVDALKALGPEPVMPLAPILTTEEPTYEGMVKALASGWPSMGLFSDEGGRFLGGHAMSPEHVVKTAAGLSKLWDGDPVTRTRAGDGHSVLYGRRLSLHLMVQPSVSQLLYGNDQIVGQGFLSRVLVAWPVSTIGLRVYREGNIAEDDAFQRYARTLKGLLEDDLPLADGSRNELNPRVLTLAPDAKTVWIAFHDHIEKLCAEGGPLAPTRGIAAKAAEHAARLAGVLTLVKDKSTSTIRMAEIQGGILLAQFYVSEAQRLHEAAEAAPELILAEQVLAWARERGGRFATETLYQYGPSRVRTKSQAERILRILEDHGHARPLPPGTDVDGKSRRNAWEVRP